MNNDEHVQCFVEDARVNVEKIESLLVKPDAADFDPDDINNLFRCVHNIKGSAGFFEFNKIVELAHCMENLFGEVRSGKVQLSGDMIDNLITANDCLKNMIDDVSNCGDVDVSGLVEGLSRFLGGSTPTITGEGSKKVEQEGASIEGISFNEETLAVLDEAVKTGHLIFKAAIRFKSDVRENGTDPLQVVEEIKSVGSILHTGMEILEIEAEEDKKDFDIELSYIFTTVLQKDFLPLAVKLPEESFKQINYEVESDSGAKETEADITEETKPAITNQAPADLSSQEAMEKKAQNVTVEDSIRVHVTLLNNLLNLASEMVLGRNQLLRAMESYRKAIPGIDSILQNVDRITTELQEKVMQTRMQPVLNVFNKFPRIIRDLSKKLGKEINLKMDGTEVELDKSIIEELGDPLTHLVRNAADHGLELPQEREKLGKPRAGTIIMKAYHEGGYVNIDIIDDGAGVNVERVKKKALEKGLISSADLSSMSEQEALLLLFKPGFSTAEAVTDLSGRGVGMDVVKTNIEKLGGAIEIFTTASKGTTFRLLLPLTLAIIPSLIVEVEGQKFALPQVNLQEIVRIKPSDVGSKLDYINSYEVLRLRGGLLPIVHLADVLGQKRTYLDELTNERKEERRKGFIGAVPSFPDNEHQRGGERNLPQKRSIKDIIRILVIKIGSRKLGIAVDEIHGSEEILVKPMPSYIKDCKCYSGVTIMGDGKIAMILDPEGIIEKANLRFADGQSEKTEMYDSSNDESIREQQNLLVFKCSGPETLAIDLSMVARVEEVKAEDIEKIGEDEFIQFREDSMRVIRPENFIRINKGKTDSKKLFVIIPKLVERPIGILIEKIHDTIQVNVNLNQEDIKIKGLVGSAVINNTIVLLLNVYELFEMADPDHYKIEKASEENRQRVVLVAEDTPFFQKTISSYLESAGYVTILAQNGKEALNILQEKKVDIVISDIKMPVMDGLELVRRIREDASLCSLPVIALTSLTGESQKKAGLDAGFDLYELKLDRMRLLGVLEKALAIRRK